MKKDKIWLLLETYESKDQCRTTSVLMASFDKQAVVKRAREYYEADTYGFFKEFGTEFCDPMFYESVYCYECFVTYQVIWQEIE